MFGAGAGEGLTEEVVVKRARANAEGLRASYSSMTKVGRGLLVI